MRANPYRRAASRCEDAPSDQRSRRLLAAEWLFASAFWLTSVICSISIWTGERVGAEGTLALIVVIGFPVVFLKLQKAERARSLSAR